MQAIFREYDIRGVVGSQLPIDQVYALGQACAAFFLQKGRVRTVAVGMDGRLTSEVIKQELVRGLLDAGLNVVFVGVCPTPVLYFSQFSLPVQAGIMITASHNPSEYNGFKIVMHRESVYGTQLQEIYGLYYAGTVVQGVRGVYSTVAGNELYIQYLEGQFAHLADMSLGVVVDCANAVGSLIFPELARRLRWRNMRFLYDTLDGTFPHHEADPVVVENMQAVAQVLAQDKHVILGIGFDGDCDRMAPMTSTGYLVPGDQLLALFAQQIVRTMTDACVVVDVKASSAIIELLQSWGVLVHMSACGHSIIKQEMKKKQAVLAGELSCHFCFKDRYFGYDDGIYAACRLIELLCQSGKTLDELIRVFPRTYSSREIRLACVDEKKKEIVHAVSAQFAQRADTQAITIDGVRVLFPYGWGLLRASNTQAVLSLRFEGTSKDALQQVKRDFIQALHPFFDEQVLRRQFEYDVCD